MANGDRYTFLGPPVHRNRWIEDEQIARSGWEYLVHDEITGAKVPVFIPDAVFGKEQAKTLILHELNKLREVHELGRTGA